MPISAATICSNALLECGADPINDLNEQTQHARLCKLLYPSLRDDVLRSHYWKCATKRVVLSPLADAPAFGWSYRFALPGDWLRTKQVGDDQWYVEFEQEGMEILANVNTLKLVYVWRNETEATWSKNLVRTMETAMAARLAYPVTKSTTFRDSKMAEAERAFRVAKAVDGQDNPPEEFGEGTLLESRFTTR